MNRLDFFLLENCYKQSVSKQTLKSIISEYFQLCNYTCNESVINQAAIFLEQEISQEQITNIVKELEKIMPADQIQQFVLELSKIPPNNISQFLQTKYPNVAKALGTLNSGTQEITQEKFYNNTIIERAWGTTLLTILTENIQINDIVWNKMLNEAVDSLQASSSTVITEAKSPAVQQIDKAITLLNRSIKNYTKQSKRPLPSSTLQSLSRLTALTGNKSNITPAATAQTTPTSTPNQITNQQSSTPPANNTSGEVATLPTPKQGFFGKIGSWIGNKLGAAGKWIKDNKWKTLGAAGGLAALATIAATGGTAALLPALAKAGIAAVKPGAIGGLVGGVRAKMQGKSWGEAGKEALKSGATGAALGGLGSLAGSAVDAGANWLTQGKTNTVTPSTPSTSSTPNVDDENMDFSIKMDPNKAFQQLTNNVADPSSSLDTSLKKLVTNMMDLGYGNKQNVPTNQLNSDFINMFNKISDMDPKSATKVADYLNAHPKAIGGLQRMSKTGIDAFFNLIIRKT